MNPIMYAKRRPNLRILLRYLPKETDPAKEPTTAGFSIPGILADEWGNIWAGR